MAQPKLTTRYLILISGVTSLLYTNCSSSSFETVHFDVSSSSLSGQAIYSSLNKDLPEVKSLLPYPGPASPLLAIGDGQIVNGVHTTFPGLPAINGYGPAHWQLDQTPGRELMRPTNFTTVDPSLDPVLGKANWYFPTADGQGHMKIYANPTRGMVYELFSKGGYVNIYGGTGYILGALNTPKQPVTGKIKLDLDFRISKLISSNPNLKNTSFHWFALSGLYFHIRDPKTGQDSPFLIQLLHANHNQASESTMYKFFNGVDATMLGGILDSDTSQVYLNEMNEFRHVSLDINKYICHATRTTFGSHDNSMFQLPAHYRDPRNWSFTGYFFDLEHAAGKCLDANPVYGVPCKEKEDLGAKLEVGVQVANISLVQQEVPNYTDVCQDLPEETPIANVYINGQANISKTIALGQSIDLRYDSTNAESCTLTAYVNDQQWYQNKDFVVTHSWGSIPFNQAGTFKWEIECKNSSGKTARASATLIVNAQVIQQSCVLPNSLGTLSHGASLDVFKSSSVSSPNVCESVKFSCNNGSLSPVAVSGTPYSKTCTVMEVAAPTAGVYIDNQLNASKTIVVGQSVDLRYAATNAISCTLTAYQNGVQWYQNKDFVVTHSWGSIPFNQAGTFKWEIECKNSSGKTARASATLIVNAQVIQQSCVLPNSLGTLSHGASLDVFKSSSVSSPNVCEGVKFSCNNGSLSPVAVSGTPYSRTCTVTEAAAPTAGVYIDNQLNASKTIVVGQSVDLRYAATNAISCTLTAYQNGTQWYQNKDFSISHSWGRIPFNETGTFKWEIICKNSAGKTTTASASLTVAESVKVPTASFFLDGVVNGSKTISVGGSVELRYDSSNAESCTLTAYQNGTQWYQNKDFSISHNWGRIPFNSVASYKWEIVCKGSSGSTASSSVSLKVQ